MITERVGSVPSIIRVVTSECLNYTQGVDLPIMRFFTIQYYIKILVDVYSPIQLGNGWKMEKLIFIKKN